MNFIKRSLFSLSGTVILLLATAPALRAQTAVADSTSIIMVEGSQIAWNFYRLILGNVNDLSHYKGDLVQTLSGGNMAYKVNDLTEVDVNNEYIVVPAKGSTFYWAYITGDQAKLRKFYIAFTMGVRVYAKRDKLTFELSHDLALSTGGIEVYNMMIGALKVGSFTEDKNKGTIQVLIGALK